MSEPQTAVTDFHFQVCGRCGHPPSDGPCIMGNEEHTDTHDHAYASYSVVRSMADQLAAAESRAQKAEAALRRAIDAFAAIVRQVEQTEAMAERVDKPKWPEWTFTADAMQSLGWVRVLAELDAEAAKTALTSGNSGSEVPSEGA